MNARKIAKNRTSAYNKTCKHDLRDDLHASLQGDFQFDGNFCYAHQLTQAPNPCMVIEGVGQVGIPLNERDAKAIIQLVNKPARGRGRGKKVAARNKTNNVYEIEASQITFGGPRWTDYVNDMVVNRVRAGLVGAKPSYLVHCELDKLLLYGPSSQPPIHQETETRDGTFATVVIRLPSLYEGGQIHITHNSQTMEFNFSSTSGVDASAVAWYKEAEPKVQPIESGYCLALSYSLVHTGSPNVVPHLPIMDSAVSKFRAMLVKWKNSPTEPEKRKKNLFAYLLQHRYAATSFQVNKANELKGQDKHLVSHITATAEELGFMVLLGLLDYEPISPENSEDDGSDSDEDHYPVKRRRYDSDSGMSDMEFGGGKNFKVKYLVDLEGNAVIGKSSLKLEEANLVPKNPLLDSHKREWKYDEPKLDSSKRQLVVVLIHKAEADRVFSKVNGTAYALAMLKRSNSKRPTSEDKKMMEIVIRGLKLGDNKTAKTLLKFATQWGVLETWKNVVLKTGHIITTFGPKALVSSLHTFGWKDLQPCFEDLLQRKQALEDRLHFIDAIQAKRGEQDQAILAWCNEWSLQALGTFSEPKTADIPMLIKVAKIRGTAFLAQEILPQLTRNLDRSSSFMMDFIASLHENRNEIPTIPGHTTPAEWAAFINKCLIIAVDQCLDLKVDCMGSDVLEQYLHSNLEKYLRIFELGIITGQHGCWPKLLQRLVAAPGEVRMKFSNVYVPFVARLGKLCRQNNFDILDPALNNFLRQLVSSYLQNILGSSSRQYLSKVRKIGCTKGCDECKELDAFIADAEMEESSFKSDVNIRGHLEDRLHTATDLLCFETIKYGRPYTLEITKQPDLVSAQQWPWRLLDAKTFLASIGDETTIARLMGDRYSDVQLAIAGARRFSEALTPAIIEAPKAPTPTQRTGKRAVPALAGTRKRKRPDTFAPYEVIDLT